jgi:hypothetical protein
MKKLLFILLLLPFFAKAQTTYQLNYDSIRVNKTAGTGGTSLYGKVYLKNTTTGLSSDSILVFRAGRIFRVLNTTVAGLQDSLTKKANRTFDNVASGAIENLKLANSTISGVALGSNLADLSAGTGLSFTAYNGSTARTANADTAVLQTVLNFFPKGDTRYAKIGDIPTLGTSAISLGGTANGLSYLSGNYRLHKVTATTGGVLTTGTDTIGGNKRFTNSGSGNTVNIDHTSGAGIGLTITKGGNGEGLIVNKTSGSGNAVTVTGQLNVSTTSDPQAVSLSSTNSGGRVLTLLGESSLEPLAVVQKGAGLIAAFTTTDGVTSLDKALIRNNGSIYTRGQLEVGNLLVGDAGDSSMVHRYLDNTVRRVPNTGTGSAVFSASPTFTGTLNGAAATFSSSATATAFIPSGATIPTNGMYLSAANTLNFATNSTNRLSISSAGAVTFTGALSGTSATFSGLITSDVITNAVLSSQAAGTDPRYIVLRNTSGGLFTGTEGSAGGFLINGSPAYYGSIVARAGLSISANDGNNLHLSIASTGAATFSETLGINGTADNVKSGTYTPTLTNGAGVTSSTAGTGMYQRVGNIVTGFVDYTATGTTEGVSGTVGVSLPIASNFTAATDVFGGYGVARSGETIASLEAVSADTTNDRFTVVATLTDLSARTVRIDFQYIIK